MPRHASSSRTGGGLLWLPLVLVGLLLMLAALAWAAMPIAELYGQALTDPLGDASRDATDPLAQDGKQIMRRVLVRLPLAIPGTVLWVVGSAMRIRGLARGRAAKRRVP